MRETTELHRRHPVEYPEGTPPLGEGEAARLHAQIDPAWQRDGTQRLWGEFTFRDFRDAFGFATKGAARRA
jgi:pterin-4a-carbinolamine dehydratase